MKFCQPFILATIGIGISCHSLAQPTSNESYDEPTTSIQVRLNRDGELIFYEVTTPSENELSNEERDSNYHWVLESEEGEVVYYGEPPSIRHPLVSPNYSSFRKLDNQEEEALISEISASISKRAKETALSFCNSPGSPERVGVTAGFSGLGVLTFNATWNVQDVCAQENPKSDEE